MALKLHLGCARCAGSDNSGCHLIEFGSLAPVVRHAGWGISPHFRHGTDPIPATRAG